MPFGSHVEFGVLSYPITVFWFVGCMNAVNLMDGLDGLAAGICLFVSVTIFLMSLQFQNTLAMLMMACLSGAILGFLMFNFYPARIFLGDSGSMLLGFLVGGLSLMGSRKAETAIALVVPVIALGLPILDTSLAILRRWSRRLPLDAPDRKHVHHVLVSMGLSHRNTVLILYAACLALGGAALLVTVNRSEVTLLVLGSLAIIAFLCIRVFGGLRFEDLVGRVSEDQTIRRRDGKAKIAVERALHDMHAAASVEDLWRAVIPAFLSLDLDYVTLRTRTQAGYHPELFSWCRTVSDFEGGVDRDIDSWLARIRILGRERVLGDMELGKAVQDRPLFAVTPALVDRLRGGMAVVLERLLSEP